MAEPFPALAAVPARPRLGYSVEQRRRIVEGLIADREEARHAGGTLRHTLLGEPVPPSSPPPAVAEKMVDKPPPVEVEAAATGEHARAETDGSGLDDFLDWLWGGDRGAGPRVADPRGSAPEAAPEPAAAPEAAHGIRLFGEATEPLPPFPPSPPAALELTFADDILSPEAEARLRSFAARVADARLRVVAEGGTPASSLERARQVARLLVEAGVPASKIELRQAGPGARVRVEALGSATISHAIGTPAASPGTSLSNGSKVP